MTLSIGVDLAELTVTDGSGDLIASPAAALAALDLFTSQFALPSSVGITTQIGEFPDFDLMTGIVSRGIVPVIWSQPTGPLTRKWSNWNLGLFDDDLDEWCTGYRQWTRTPEMVGLPITIVYRFAQEANANFMAYNSAPGNANGNTVTNWKAAWKRIHDRIRIVNGCTEVGMYYCAWTVPSNLSHSITSMFVGPQWTQYMGPDAYSASNNNTGPWSEVSSMRAMLNAAYVEIAALDPDIPILVGESGVERGNLTTFTATDAERASWITGTGWAGSGAAGGFDWVAANEPRIALFDYFDISNWQLAPASYPLMKAAMTTAMESYPGPFASETDRPPVYASGSIVSF